MTDQIRRDEDLFTDLMNNLLSNIHSELDENMSNSKTLKSSRGQLSDQEQVLLKLLESCHKV